MTVAAQLRLKGKPARVDRHGITLADIMPLFREPATTDARCSVCSRRLAWRSFRAIVTNGVESWPRTVRFVGHVGPKT